MNDNLIYELEHEQEIGEELANKLNDNYTIDKIEIILDEIDDNPKTKIYIDIYKYSIEFVLDSYYNNKIIYICYPLLNKSEYLNPKVNKNSILAIHNYKNYKLKINIKHVEKKYYYRPTNITGYKCFIEYQPCKLSLNQYMICYNETNTTNLDDFINYFSLNYNEINEQFKFSNDIFSNDLVFKIYNDVNNYFIVYNKDLV